MEMEKKDEVTQGAGMPQQPAPMPEPASVSQAQPAEPVVPQPPVEMPPSVQQQPINEPIAQPVEIPPQPQIEPVMKPIDLSATVSEMPQVATMDVQKKRMIMLIIAIVAGLVVGVGGFYVWKAMNLPVEEMAPIEEVAEQVVKPESIAPAIEADDLSVIEQELDALNVGNIDIELQSDLDAINAAF